MKYNRILMKVSGSALGENNGAIFSKNHVNIIVDEIINIKKQKVEIAILVGGGNIFRGCLANDLELKRIDADSIGMLATVINSIMLKDKIISKTDFDVRIMTPFCVSGITEVFNAQLASRYLSEDKILIFGGGIGLPFFSTDYPTIHRALEIEADVVLIAKNGVDGIYTSDPHKNNAAKKYKKLTYDEAINNNLNVMDKEAFVLAQKYNVPLYFYNFSEKDIIQKIYSNKDIGTAVNSNIKTCFY